MRVKRLVSGLAMLFLLLPAVMIGGAAALEGYDPFCAACHTDPEVEYVV